MTTVIYASNYGAAKQYAGWIAEELGCQCTDVKKVKEPDLQAFDTIVFCGGIYAGGINGIKLIKNSLPLLAGKNIIVATVGLALSDDPALQQQRDTIFTKEQQRNIKFFHLRGFMDMEKLGFMHRSMMKMLTKALAKKPQAERTSMDGYIIDLANAPVNFMDRESIAPLCSVAR